MPLAIGVGTSPGGRSRPVRSVANLQPRRRPLPGGADHAGTGPQRSATVRASPWPRDRNPDRRGRRWSTRETTSLARCAQTHPQPGPGSGGRGGGRARGTTTRRASKEQQRGRGHGRGARSRGPHHPRAMMRQGRVIDVRSRAGNSQRWARAGVGQEKLSLRSWLRFGLVELWVRRQGDRGAPHMPPASSPSGCPGDDWSENLRPSTPIGGSQRSRQTRSIAQSGRDWRGRPRRSRPKCMASGASAGRRLRPAPRGSERGRRRAARGARRSPIAAYSGNSTSSP